MSKEAIIGHNRIEDVRWLCSLTESELDMLIGLKTMVIRRAKKINHEALSKKFDLRMLRALGFVLMEYLKGQLKDFSDFSDLTESLESLDESNFLKINLNDEFGDMSIEELFAYIGTGRRKRIAEIFSEDMAPKQKKKTETEDRRE